MRSTFFIGLPIMPFQSFRSCGIRGKVLRFTIIVRGVSFERIGVVLAHPGDVNHVYPPSRDIHQIMNRSSRPTISIHIYGGDIGSQRRHTYDENTGAMHDFVSGYDPGC